MDLLYNLAPPEITITPDRNVFTAEITNTDENADRIYYAIDTQAEFNDYSESILGLTEGQVVYAYAYNTETGDESEIVSKIVEFEQ